jgi:hypothetical protein
MKIKIRRTTRIIIIDLRTTTRTITGISDPLEIRGRDKG